MNPTAAAFTQQLFAHCDEDSWLTLFAINRTTGKRTLKWASCEAPEDLAEYAAQLDDSCVWIGAATRTHVLDDGKRGGREDCDQVPALWLDIDVAGPNHAADNLPPTLEAARQLLGSHPIPPTVIVETGGGLQAWWMLTEPATVAEYEAIAPRWANHWAVAASMHGWHIDNVSDTARIMRLPGTHNTKADTSVPVVIVHNDETRHELSDLAEGCDPLPEVAEPETATATSTPHPGIRPGDEYNRRHDGSDVLRGLGFTLTRTDRNGDTHWTRPGKESRDGTSATVYADDGHTTIWSDTCTSMWPSVQVRRPYDPFGLHVATTYHGNWTEATRALSAQGYGDTPTATSTELATFSPPATESARLTIRWTDELDDLPPRPPELVKGLIRKGDMVVLGAPRALGKSWAVAGLALLLAQGHGEWFDTFQICGPANVVVLQGEVDQWSSAERWQTLAGRPRPPRLAESFDRARIKVMRRRLTHITPHGQVTDDQLHSTLDDRIYDAVERTSCDLLIFDPWAVYFGGNENSNDEVEAALATLKVLMDAGVAIILVHHVGKSSDMREPEDLWRGASRLADWASTRITMLPHYSTERAKKLDMPRHVARTHADLHFLRRGEPVEDFSIKRSADGWWRRWVDPDAEASSVAGVSERKVAAVIAAQPGITTAKLADHLKISHSSARRLVGILADAGAIEAMPGARGGMCWFMSTAVDNPFGSPDPEVF